MIVEYANSTYDYAVDMKKTYTEELSTLKELTFDGWLVDIRDYVLDGTLSTQRRGPLELIESANERVVMLAIVLSANPDSLIELDVSDLYEGGWLSDVVIAESNTDISWTMDTTPPIILTEGVFDRKVLIDSVSLLRPEIASYLRFLDTGYKTEGGASAILKMLKSFAAAGISNRILVILDNDTAAREAISTIKNYRLPKNFGVVTLPIFDALKDYPTIGPQGLTGMDINGLAAALELYLGEDVLRNSDNALIPVQWTGYNSRMSTYQGELTQKSVVQKKFAEKISIARKHPELVKDQDWTGLELIIDNILLELSNLR